MNFKQFSKNILLLSILFFQVLLAPPERIASEKEKSNSGSWSNTSKDGIIKGGIIAAASGLIGYQLGKYFYKTSAPRTACAGNIPENAPAVNIPLRGRCRQCNQDSNLVALPCGDRSTCQECTIRIMETTRICPACAAYFGVHHPARPNLENGIPELCVVCMDAPSIMAFIPCGHKIVCQACATRTMGMTGCQRRCPLCRSNPREAIRIFD